MSESVRARIFVGLSPLLLLALTVPYAHAQSAPPTTAQTSPQRLAATRDSGLRYDLPRDLAITGGAMVVSISLELLTPSLVKSCRWCDRNPDGSDSLNGFDASARKALRWNATQAADMLSSVFSYVLAPLAGISFAAIVTTHDDRLDEMPEDLLVVAQSAFIAIALDEVGKIAFARERPDVHARSPYDRARMRATSDNLSFYSGHTTLSFALAVSAGTIASMRGYRLAPLMWVVALSLASISGWLRMAADRHYLSDVLVGAVVGSAIGFGVPYLFHRGRPHALRLSAVPLERGSLFGLSGTF